MNLLSRFFFLRRTLGLVVVPAFVSGLLVAGCGGGGDAGPASGGTGAAAGTFAAGPITGFGSVIVNGVRFDDATAVVTDDEGGASSKDALRLGMTAEVRGGKVSDDGSGPRARADGITFGAAVVGPVSAVDAVAKSLVVLGQRVLVLDTTVLDNRLVGGFAGITVGMLLEVHGTLDASTDFVTATRIEPTAAAAGFRLRGIVAALDTAARTFRIGGALISYGGVSAVPADLANGLLLRVRVQTTPVAGAWVATRLGAARPHVEDADEAHLKGSITAFTSTAAFSVNGIPVDASGAIFSGGTAGIVLGAQVEVEGRSLNGTVLAKRVSVETHEARRAEGFELHGTVGALDTAARTFVLRSVTVRYGAAGVEFRHGTPAQLANGAQLEVRGTLSADGSTLAATRISFGD